MSSRKLARKRAGKGRPGRRPKTKPGARRGRTKRARRAAKRLPDSVFELTDALETPFRRTQDLVMALHYVGYGLSSLEDDSAPAVNGLAEALESHVHEMRAVLGFERGR